VRSAAPPYLCLPAQRARLPLQHTAAFSFIELSLTFELPARSRIRSFACHSGSLAALESKSPKGAALSDSDLGDLGDVGDLGDLGEGKDGGGQDKEGAMSESESLESYDSDDNLPALVSDSSDSDSDESDSELARRERKKPAQQLAQKKPAMMQPAPAPPSSDDSDEDSTHLDAVTSNANKFNTVSRYTAQTPSLHLTPEAAAPNA
jgi:hypothetical protein